MSAARQLRESAQLDDCLDLLNKPIIHFFLIGEQLLHARALLYALEMSVPGPGAIRLYRATSTVSDMFDELSCVLTRGWDYGSI